MAIAGGPTQLRVSKSTLSMFLRTKCDKELFLSLHDKKTMAAAGLPEPIKRPGIGLLAVEGAHFEIGRNDQLVRLFGGIISYSKTATQYGNIDLQAALSGVTSFPRLILQGHFSIAAQQPKVLSTIGVDATNIPWVPPIADFIPDILYIRDAQAGDQEVLPGGTRRAIDEVDRGTQGNLYPRRQAHSGGKPELLLGNCDVRCNACKLAAIDSAIIETLLR